VIALTADRAIAAQCLLGEAPTWHADAQALEWVDVPAARWHRWDVRGRRHSTIDLGGAGDGTGAGGAGRLSWIGPRRAGGRVALLDGTLTLLGTDGTVESRRTLLPTTGTDLVLNDACCDARGHLWLGTASPRPRSGALLRIAADADPDAPPELVVDGVSMSNGIDWSPDGRTLYHVDSAAGSVDAFACHPATGVLHDRRRLISVPVEQGLPDGLTVDAHGDLWVAVWGSGEIHCHAADGRLRAIVEVPADQVTSCAFGGRDLDALWITTARDGLDQAELAQQPDAGALFRCVPGGGVRGRVPHAFAG
jgi:sugar lactone lactonase YvrE